MQGKPDWRDALNPQEKSELRELDRKIKQQQKVTKKIGTVHQHSKLIVLKYQRKVIQNRVTVRARRSSLKEMSAAE